MVRICVTLEINMSRVFLLIFITTTPQAAAIPRYRRGITSLSYRLDASLWAESNHNRASGLDNFELSYRNYTYEFILMLMNINFKNKFPVWINPNLHFHKYQRLHVLIFWAVHVQQLFPGQPHLPKLN